MTLYRPAIYSLLTVALWATGTITVTAQAPVVRATPTDISQRLARIEQQLQNQGLLDMLQQLENLQRELRQLRGEVEVQGRNIEELKSRQRALYTDIDQRLQRLEGTATTDLSALNNTTTDSPPLQVLAPAYEPVENIAAQSAETSLNIEMLATTPAPQQPSGPGSEVPPLMAPAQPGPVTHTTPGAISPDPLTAPVDPVQMQAEYQQAFGLLKNSQYETAILEFAAFLNKYPNAEYSDNAQYWLGEAYYVMRRFEQALAEYNKLVVNFPHSQKYTHALLKIGYCYHELGQIDEARKYLQSLTRQYPGETASRLAEERLKTIALSAQQTGTPQN